MFLFPTYSCQSNGDGPVVKVYVSKPEQGGLVRNQDNELVQYADSENYRCLNKEDFDKLINYCFNPDQNNDFEQTRSKLRNAPKKFQTKALNNVTENYKNSFLNQKGMKK